VVSFCFSSILFRFFKKLSSTIFARRVVADFLQQYDSKGGVNE